MTGRFEPEDIPYENILRKLQLKYLKINWYGDMPLKNCPGALLIPKLLLHHGQTLEEIEVVDGPSWWDWLYDSNDLKNGKLWLPNLKVIKGKPLEVCAFSSESVWKLVRAAPNLEDLVVCVTSKDLRKGLAPPDRYNIIKSLCFECETNFDIQAFNKFVSTEPRVRYLVVKYYQEWYREMNDSENGVSSSDDSLYFDDDDDLDENLCWEVFKRLLKSSRESLEMIRLPVYVLAAKLGSDWQVFPNVTQLSLEIPLKQHEEELYTHEVLRQFDFRAKFPNLTSVILFQKRLKKDSPCDAEHFQNSIDDQPMMPLDYSSKISRLALKNFVTDFGLAYSSSVFAYVTELDLINVLSDKPIPYRTIWKEWPRLEVLSIREGFWGNCVNYDAEFVGISKTEARELQWMEAEDVKDLHIVPTRPGITTMKNLRQVTVNFLKNRGYGKDRESEKFFLSPAACILTVHRMPQLKFKLICSHGHLSVSDLMGIVNIDFR